MCTWHRNSWRLLIAWSPVHRNSGRIYVQLLASPMCYARLNGQSNLVTFTSAALAFFPPSSIFVGMAGLLLGSVQPTNAAPRHPPRADGRQVAARRQVERRSRGTDGRGRTAALARARVAVGSVGRVASRAPALWLPGGHCLSRRGGMPNGRLVDSDVPPFGALRAG